MSKPNYVYLIARAWKQLLFAFLMGLVLALAFSLVQPLRYSSTIKLLITQTNPSGLDPYTAIKATERIAQNLSEIIYTTGFFTAVTSDSSVDKTYFSTDEIKKRKQWEKTIATRVIPGTGVMAVTAYHSNRDQAAALAVKVGQGLTQEAPNYFGFSVRVQMIDAPLPSRFFAKPNFLQNAVFGAMMGLLVGCVWVLWKVKE
jgi:capsular polysaccharide biosynthesis protein